MKNLDVAKKDGKLSARIPRKRMNNVQRILQKKGLTHSDAINIFYEFVEKINDFPFEVETEDQRIERISKNLSEMWAEGEFEAFKKIVLDRKGWDRHLEF